MPSSLTLFLKLSTTSQKLLSRTKPYWRDSRCCGWSSVLCPHTSWGHFRWCSLPGRSSCSWSVSRLAPCYGGCLQSGLWVLCQNFCNVVIEEDKEGNIVVGPNGEPKVKTPNPHVELPYTYFMTWYIMHCPTLMSEVQSSEDFMPFVQQLEHSSCSGWYMLMIRQILQSSMKYQLVRCFLDFPGASYGERFFDRPGTDGFTTHVARLFWWLINIRSGYLVFW